MEVKESAMSESDYAREPSRALRQDLLALLERLGPRTVLAVGATAGDVARIFSLQHAEVEVARFAACAVDGVPGAARDVPADCALVSELEQLPCREAGILLSRLRDLYARYLVVSVRLGGPWSESDLLGYGLRRLGRYPGSLHVYAF